MSNPFEIMVDTDRVIRGNLYPSKQEALGTIVVCHGFKGYKDWGFFPYCAQQLAEKHDVVTFNFSHNGVGEELNEFGELEKFAKQTYSHDLEDLHTVMDHLRKQTLPLKNRDTLQGEKRFLLGHSRGAGIAFIYTFDYPEQIDGVISWNGITNVDLLTPEMKEQMRRDGRTYIENARTKQLMPLDHIILDDMEQNRARFDIIQRAQRTSTPIILIQGTEDMERLLEGSQRLIDANSRIEWVKIEDGNHTFGAVHPFQGTTEPLERAIAETKAFLARFHK